MFSHLHCHPKWHLTWRAGLLCLLSLVMPVCMAQNASTPAGQSSKTTASNSANATTATTATANSDSKTAPTGNVRYCSIFTQYQRLNQQTVTPWRESNDAVQQAGGWRALAREARAPESASTAANMTQPQNCPPGVAAAHGGQP